ncbi:MAG: histidine kinase [bacterium]|nr:histidine kinase [bacterium]
MIQLLIIQDTPSDQLGILDAIKKADLRCNSIIAVSIKEAQSQFNTHSFDLIISEYQLSDGIVLDLLPIANHIPIIVITKISNEIITLNIMKAGIYDYIIKDEALHYLTVLPITIQSVLRRKQLERDAHEQQIFTATLREIATSLNSTLELSEILHRILENVRRIIPHDASSIMLIEESVAKVVLCSGWGEDVVPILMSTRFPISGVEHFRMMYTTRGFYTIPDISTFSGWVQVDGVSNPSSYLAAPICFNDEVIGFLNLNSHTVNHFTPVHAERLRAFVDQAAIALQNARLYQQAQALATMDERQRLARDLHDSVTQTLFAIAMTTQAIFKQWKQDAYSVGESLGELQDLTQGALAEIRTLLLELRPSALLEADLADLLRQLCATIKGRSRVQVDFHTRGKADITPEAHRAFFRIAQESLNNIIKHSRAKKATMRFTRRVGRVELIINDDGIGFNPENIPASHMGIKIMQERAHDANIALTITSLPKGGTTIRALWMNKEL